MSIANKHYQTTFILKPVLDKKEQQHEINQVVALLKQEGATILYQENKGASKLAYPVDKYQQGIYAHIEFQAPPTLVEILETHYKQNESIIRFLTINLPSAGILFYQNQRNATANNSNA